jgi:large subunit ribosomal protein L5
MATDDTKDKKKKKAEPVAEEEVKPKPRAKKAAAEETAAPKPKPRAKKAAAEAEATEPVAEPKPKPKAKAKPKAEVAPEPEAVTAPAGEPKPKPKAKAKPKAEPAPEPEAVAAPVEEPKPKPKVKAKAEPAPEPVTETAEEPKPKAKAKLAAPPRLMARYFAEIVPNLIKRFSYKNTMQVPKLLKISINKGIGKDVDSAKAIESATMEVTRISGQKPVITRARKSIANFKLRKGMPIGCMVTLRKRRMYEFMDRLLSIVLPRIRDFRGVNPNAFDGRGNYSLGLTEQLIFPEIKYDDVSKVSGFCISFHTTAHTDEECRALLEEMGMPFGKR